MKIYHIHPTTKEFLESSFAQIDPAESLVQDKEVYLMPANTTDVEPPEVSEGLVSVWDEDKKQWAVKPDHRGIYYNKQSQARLEVHQIGFEVGDEYTVIEPPGPGYVFNGEVWEKDINSVKEVRKSVLAAQKGFAEEQAAILKRIIAGESPDDILAEKEQAIDAAKTIEEVEAITWS